MAKDKYKTQNDSFLNTSIDEQYNRISKKKRKPYDLQHIDKY